MKKSVLITAGVVAALAFSYFAINTVARRSKAFGIYATEMSGKDDSGCYAPSMIDTFNCIYATGTWARDDATGKGTSGTGSTLEITREYRAYLENFIKDHAVKSVVDAGCGDWSFSSAIDWGDASYLGVDIASDVINAVRKKHEKGKIKFEVGDITQDLPASDLLISKDVLQHLSNELVHKFIKNNLRKGKYKWVILTNDRGSENPNIETGGYRMIDLTAPPFEVKGLVDVPIKYGTETRKITSLLDLTQQP
jgi:SAM-dependent methyltransferase